MFFLVADFLTAQQLTNSDYAAYIQKYKSIAVREMLLYKIPASITLAQGMIESGCGKSTLAVDSKNHFGIKCQKEWTGEKYYHDDDKADECFRMYNSIDESYRDHSLFLSTRKRYAALFTLPITDYKGWATGLKLAGYATNPDYPNMLIRVIENNQLFLLDDTLKGGYEEIAINGPDEEKKHPDNKHSGADKQIVNSIGHILFQAKYKMPEPEEFDYLYTSELGRKVYQNCDVPFIFALKNDTWSGIAKEFRIYKYQVFKQNDLLEADPIVPGMMLYLEPKKRKNPEKTYKVQKSDCLYSISQLKCVRLPRLLKYNKLKPGDEPKPGSALKLSR
jgi:hypothetical protein